jgi:hypothetical protein
MCQRCQSLDQFFSDIAIFRQQVPVSCLNIGMIFEFFYIPLRPCTQIWVNSSCGCLIHKVENKKSLACIIIIISFWSTLKLSLKWPSLHHVFLGLLSRHIPTRFPSFSGIRKAKTFYEISVWNGWFSALNARGSRLIIVVVQVGAVKINVAVEAFKEKGKTGRNSVYYQNWWFFFWVSSPLEC